MKAYITEGEYYPCLSVVLKDTLDHEHEINAPEEKIREWIQIAAKFFQMQQEVQVAILEHKNKQDEIRHLKLCFNNPNPSRTDKAYILDKFGWTQIDTSLWEKDNKQLRLHEAYNEVKQKFENENP